jgi:hypothetical protein
MARTKVVGFEIRIKGQKEVKNLEGVLKLVNVQLVEMNSNLNAIKKQGGKPFKKLNEALKESSEQSKDLAKQLKPVNTQLSGVSRNLGKIDTKAADPFKKLDKALDSTTGSAGKLGGIIQSAFESFQDGNKIVQNLGSNYKDLTKQIDKTAKETKKAEDSFKKTTKSKEEARKEAEELKKEFDVQGDSIQELIDDNKELKKAIAIGTSATGEQSSAVKRLAKEYQENQEKIKRFRKEQLTGIKVTEAAEGSLDQLRAQATKLKKQYNALSGAQQNAFTGDGPRIRKELLATQKRIQKLDLAVKDGRTSIGLYANAQRGLSKVLLRLTVGRSVLEGVANGFRNIFNGLKELATGTEEARERFADLNSAGGRLTSTLTGIGNRFLETFGGGITKLIDNVSFSASVVGDAFIDAAQDTDNFSGATQTLIDLFNDFPSVIGGVLEVFKELSAPLEALELQSKKAGIELRKLFQDLLGFDTSDAQKELDDINQKLEENGAFGRSIGEAYREGFENTKAAQEEFIRNADEQVESEKRLEAARKKRDKAQEEADAAEKKRIADLKRDREALLRSLESEALARVKIAANLSQQLTDLQIASIKDTTARRLAAEKERRRQEKEANKRISNDLVRQTLEREEQIKKLFGENSKELADFRKKSSKDLALIQSQSNERLQKRKETAAKLRAIREKRLADQKAAAEKEEAERVARVAATKGATINLVNATFQAIADISKIAFDAEQARFDDAINKRQANISKLNEDLANATGLQKIFLEKQVEQEEKALEAETKAKEKARKEQGEAQKAIAITQAIIAAALGVANAFSLPPPASFIAAAATAVATGAQIAVIASQKFAKGGVLSGPSHAQGGIPIMGGRAEAEGGEGLINKNSMKNPALRAIASAVNEAGGGVPFDKVGGTKFANGGITGAPISAPNVGRATSDIDQKFNEFLGATMGMIAATNRRIDRQQVVLDVNNLQEQTGNESTLEAQAVLSE